MTPLPRGTRKPYEFLWRDVVSWWSDPETKVTEGEIVQRATEFVVAMEKALESARVRARRRKS